MYSLSVIFGFMRIAWDKDRLWDSDSFFPEMEKGPQLAITKILDGGRVNYVFTKLLEKVCC